MLVKNYKKIVNKETNTIEIKTDLEWDDFEEHVLGERFSPYEKEKWYEFNKVEDITVLETEDNEAFILKSVYSLEK